MTFHGGGKITNMKQEKPNILRETFSSSSGHLSSKRILGGIVLISCLLGITSVTNIWKSSKTTKRTKIEEEI